MGVLDPSEEPVGYPRGTESALGLGLSVRYSDLTCGFRLPDPRRRNLKEPFETSLRGLRAGILQAWRGSLQGTQGWVHIAERWGASSAR